MEVPNPIGAKGPNPHHGGQHPKKGDGNPGGGNGNGHWGEGNNGNGKGNIYTGNQGNGVGEGMAGGTGKPNPDPDPDPPNDPGPDPDPDPNPDPDPDPDPEPAGTPAAPLADRPEVESSGCPALMQWFASEVGIEESQINIILSNSGFLATDIQPCEACARLKEQAEAMNESQVDTWASAIRTGLAGPITPELLAGIRNDLAANPDALSFDDAATEYVRILTDEFGFETADAVAVAMNNYAADHADLEAYINARVNGL